MNEEKLAKAIKFTKKQKQAIESLCKAVERCNKIGVGFVFDHDISSVVAVNTSKCCITEYDWFDTETDASISFSNYNEDKYGSMDDCKHEVIHDVDFTSEWYNLPVLWVGKDCVNMELV